MFNPLVITAYLQTPVYADAHLPIDGILMYYAYRDALGPQDVTVSGHQPDLAPVDVPLAKHYANSPEWFYAASFAQWSHPVTTGIDHWNKRFDQNLTSMVDFRGKRGKVIIEQGQYKAYHMPIHYRHSLSVHWYVVGDGDRIRLILSHCTHIGKKTAQGYGAVLRWECNPWHEDWSIYNADGVLMRAIPVSDGGVLYGYRPSYWLPENQTMCKLPCRVASDTKN